jgi:hypothetical protein
MDHETKVRRGPRYRPSASTRIRTLDSAPTRVDEAFLATMAGIELTAACGGGAKVGLAGGVDERTGRRWISGDPANPLTKLGQIILRAVDPWRIVSWAASMATLAMVRKLGPLTEEKWRAAYLEACRTESHPDGHEDVVTTELLTGRASLEQQRRADSAHVTALLRRIALGWIGQQNKYSLVERAH